MHQMVAGYQPVQSALITKAEECASCHTLYTSALGPGGKPVGHLPEQMTFDEWLHSGYHNRETCQQCHMPEVHGQVAIASIMSPPLSGVRRHTFVGSNFFMEDILDANRAALNVTAPSAAMTAEAKAIVNFLQTKAARVSLSAAQLSAGRLSFAVQVVNLSGHKLPTGFPSRRAWLHVVVTDAHGRTVFESGKLNPDGSIVGNANDASPARYSPNYSLITQPTQVEIFEPILGDDHNHVTTGLVSATHYLKDNRILPAGFDKQIAPPNIAVYGKAASDPDFIGGSATTRYAISTHGAAGPFHVAASLVYQPIGYRWAHNLAAYKGEPQRFVHEYEQAAAHSSLVLAHAQTTVSAAH
jgi:hypothetical protein